MRVQVYQEELGEGVEVIEQTSRNGEHFYGLRIWLKTCQPLLDHSTPEDDDRSAVTFWFQGTAEIADFIMEMQHARNRAPISYRAAGPTQTVMRDGSVRDTGTIRR